MSFNEGDAMKDNQAIRITVRPLEDRPGEYVAVYGSEFLQAEFCVTVKDSIFGALALQAFAEMIRTTFGKHYRTGRIDFELSSVPAPLHSRPLLDVVEHAFSA
jgi:hypothetical protein